MSRPYRWMVGDQATCPAHVATILEHRGPLSTGAVAKLGRISVTDARRMLENLRDYFESAQRIPRGSGFVWQDAGPSLNRHGNAAARKRLIYFAQRVDGGPIKIGIAANPQMRLKALQTALPEHSPGLLRILAVMPGNWFDEQRLLTRFAGWRMRGEWFDETCPELLALINEAQEKAA